MDRKEIGRKIEKLRKERNMSQYQLAMDAGLSTSYIPDLEKGLKCPTVETLDNICYALHITLSEFFANAEEKASHNKLESLNDKQRKLLNEFLEAYKAKGLRNIRKPFVSFYIYSNRQSLIRVNMIYISLLLGGLLFSFAIHKSDGQSLYCLMGFFLIEFFIQFFLLPFRACHNAKSL